MNFLIDAQLPPALAQLITSLGHNAVHVEEASATRGHMRDHTSESVISGLEPHLHYAVHNEADIAVSP